MLFPRWHFLPFSPFCASSPSVLFFLLVFLPSFSNALYIVRMEYIPVELLDEFSDGRGTVSREKRRAESPVAEEAEDEYAQEQLAAAEMALMDRAYKAKLRQLAEEEAEEEEENERRDREELAQRWDTLRRTIEDNVKRMEDGEGQRGEEDDEDEDGTEQGREKEGEGEGQIVLASPLGSDDYGPAEIVPLAMVVDGGQRLRAQRRSGDAGGEETILLEL
ncbi:hypothetical protein niasHT_007581 [Heterodera trifolii]|uniref:Uncharacterized protein n=1 Tax=Heterodera trifolii TaxID=157864 RepID=A0ABD2LQ09_9BILA